MDLVFPIIYLLLILTGLALLPVLEEGVRRVRLGLSVLRAEMLVQAARRAYVKATRR